MVETLFSAPHDATHEEVRRLYSLGPRDKFDIEEFRIELEGLANDQRMTHIYDLYALRGDQAMMEGTLARIEDRIWAYELAYRDVVPVGYGEGG